MTFPIPRPRGEDAPAKPPTKKAAEAMGYRAVQTIYLWPETLPQATADRVAGVVARMAAKPPRKAKATPEAA